MIFTVHFDLKELFDFTHTRAKGLLESARGVGDILPKIGEFIEEISMTLGNEYTEIKAGVFAARDAIIASTAHIEAPSLIGSKTQIRHSAFIRGCAIIGDGAVIGNSTEIKNSIIFDRAELPHYNYVGDSILGYRAHLGAGVIISNLRLDKKTVRISENGEKLDTGLRKLGALVGDFAEIGCNSVLCPGTVIGKGARIYPLSTVSGKVADGAVIRGEILGTGKTIKGE